MYINDIKTKSSTSKLYKRTVFKKCLLKNYTKSKFDKVFKFLIFVYFIIFLSIPTTRICEVVKYKPKYL